MLYELLYSSVSTRNMQLNELLSLLHQSRDKNAQLGVTGLLLYRQCEFMQAIEGEEKVIRSLWNTIRFDERHFSARIIYEGLLPERGFANWSMGFQDFAEVNTAKLKGYSSFLEKGFTSEIVAQNPSTARRLMETVSEFVFDH